MFGILIFISIINKMNQTRILIFFLFRILKLIQRIGNTIIAAFELIDQIQNLNQIIFKVNLISIQITQRFVARIGEVVVAGVPDFVAQMKEFLLVVLHNVFQVMKSIVPSFVSLSSSSSGSILWIYTRTNIIYEWKCIFGEKWDCFF